MIRGIFSLSFPAAYFILFILYFLLFSEVSGTEPFSACGSSPSPSPSGAPSPLPLSRAAGSSSVGSNEQAEDGCIGLNIINHFGKITINMPDMYLRCEEPGKGYRREWLFE